MIDAQLALEGVVGGYGASRVLHGVGFELRPGETVTLLGRNGVGKTTTLRAIMGLVSAQAGSIRFEGREIRGSAPRRVARLGIGYVPEERGIFTSLSVRENLLLPIGPPGAGRSIDELFELFPNLAERQHARGGTLSGGEQQMLAIARILRTGATLLLLDEPTEGLAPAIVGAIGRALHELREHRMSVLLVEQNFAFARDLSDRFLVMDHGSIVDAFAANEVDGRRDDLTRLLGV